MEGYHGLCATSNRNDAQPALSLLGNLNRDTVVGLAAQVHGNITALNGDGSVLGVITLDLDERLLDVDHGHVYQLNSSIINTLGTLDGNNVTYFHAPAREVLLIALSIQRTIDVNLTGLILNIPVTIGRVHDTLYSTGHAVGLALGTGINLGTSCLTNYSETLDHVDGLGLVGALHVQHSSAAIKGSGSREGHFGLTSATIHRAHGQPFGKFCFVKRPSFLGIQGNRVGTAGHVNAHIG